MSLMYLRRNKAVWTTFYRNSFVSFYKQTPFILVVHVTKCYSAIDYNFIPFVRYADILFTFHYYVNIYLCKRFIVLNAIV